MAKKNSMKRALLFGATSMALSVSMFVGTTFAWFTDTVTSNNNKIVAGNLDVELYYQVEDQTDWTKVGTETNVFKANTLWEPGHTEVVRLKVVNEGSLALKYQLGVNIASETTSTNVYDQELKLSNFIEYGLVEGANNYTTREAAITAVKDVKTALNVAYNSGTTKLTVDDTATTDVKENEDFVTMVVYMPTTVGNDANAKKGAVAPKINLGINLYATQVEAEDDSFGGDYDDGAYILPIVNNAAELASALEQGESVKLGNDMVIPAGGTITIPEGEEVTLDLNGKSLTAENSATEYAINNLGNLTLKDSSKSVSTVAYASRRMNSSAEASVSARGIYNGYSADGNHVTTAKITVENGVYNAMGTNGGAAIFNYGVAEIKGGTFTSVFSYSLNNQATGKMIIDNASVANGVYNLGELIVNGGEIANTFSGRHGVYNEGTVTINGGNFSNTSANETIRSNSGSVTINGGTFTQIGKSFLFTAGVTIKGGSFFGYVNEDGTNDKMRPGVVVKGGTFNFDPTAWMTSDVNMSQDANGNFIVEGKEVGEAFLNALKNGENVTMTKDINLAGIEIPVIEYSGVLDGNGFAIKNLKGENGLFDKLNGATVKNLKLENVDIDATSNHTGALAGYVVKSAGAQTVIDNVTVSGDIVGGEYYVGGIVGADSNYDTVIKNCVNNATVTAPGQQVGGIVGYATRKTLVENCVNNGAVTGGSFVGGIIGFASGDDDMPESSITVKSCANNAAVAETNLGPAVTWQGGVGGIIGNVGRAAGDNAVKPLNFYISADCTVLDGQPIYGQKHNVLGGHDTLLNVWILEEVSNDAELTAALGNLKNLDNTVFYGTAFELAEGTYAADYDITVANLGEAKGDLYFKAADGAEVVFTGTTTMGLFVNQTFLVKAYHANIAYEGIIFEHAQAEHHSINIQNIGRNGDATDENALMLLNCKFVGGGEYGIRSDSGSLAYNSKIIGCTFENAGMQIYGNFGTGLVIDDCDFVDSCINVQGGKNITVQNCTFSATVTDVHNGESFYVIRTQAIPMTVKNCEFSIDSTVTGVGVAGSKGWGVFVNRNTADWTVSDVKVTFTEAALAQTALKVATCLSTGKINCTNVTLNGEAYTN